MKSSKLDLEWRGGCVELGWVAGKGGGMGVGDEGRDNFMKNSQFIRTLTNILSEKTK